MARIRKMVICPKCGEKKIMENETERKKKKERKGGKGTVFKLDSPALRTGNDKLLLFSRRAKNDLVVFFENL